MYRNKSEADHWMARTVCGDEGFPKFQYLADHIHVDLSTLQRTIF